MRTKKAGFTLAELLAVVAIIAVLVAIAIPVFSASKEKAEETVCLANRNSLQRQCIIAIISEGMNSTQAQVNTLVGEIQASRGTKLCPCDGVYTLKALPDGTVKVTCSIHGGDEYVPAWERDASYAVGDVMSSGGYIFRCIKAMDKSNKNPAVSTDRRWVAVESVSGIPQAYDSRLIYAKGALVITDGTTYARNGNTPSFGGGQPYKGSPYWEIIS